MSESCKTFHVEGADGTARRQWRWWAPAVCAAVLAPILAAFLLQNGLAWTCAFKGVTGFPCATCGGTRALGALAQLQFGASVSLNPLAAMSPLIVAFSPWIVRLREQRWFWPAAWGAIALNWIYLIFAGR